jgi:hypothetical protein
MERENKFQSGGASGQAHRRASAVTLRQGQRRRLGAHEKDARRIAGCDNADPLFVRAAMTDAPPFDPPYFSAEKTEQGVRVVETGADGSRRERMVPTSEAAGLLFDPANRAPAAPSSTRSNSKKPTRAASGMPPGSTLLAVPFSEKDAAKKLGARWNADGRSWYVPPGVDMAPFSRWRKGEASE